MPQARSSQVRRQSGGARKGGTDTGSSSASSKGSTGSGAGGASGGGSGARRAAKSRAGSRATAKDKPKTSARAQAKPKTSARAQATPKTSARAAAKPVGSEDPVAAALAVVRERLTRGLVITGERLQETMDETVTRGRMTRSDAEDLLQRLLNAGRRQTDDVLSELEQLVGRSREVAADAGKLARSGVQRARRSDGSDRVLRTVDRARRAAGIGPSFPIIGYDDLGAAQIAPRLDELGRAELRKVRDYERRNGNRKSVLEAIERKLS